MTDDRVFLNGIDPETGEYLVPPFTPEQGAAFARASTLDADMGQMARERLKRLSLPFGVDGRKIDSAGWGIVFAPGTPQKVKDALQPLIDHRKAAVPAKVFHQLQYDPEKGVKQWLESHDMGRGNVLPHRVPYFLALVGGPEAIPFEFQYGLVEYAVGRICFDTPDQYRQYADSVVSYETAKAAATNKEVTYWGVRVEGDVATMLSGDHLIQPLFKGVPEDDQVAIAEMLNYKSTCLLGPDATRDAIAGVLHGKKPPTMLMTASHGVGWSFGKPKQRSEQGALLSQDWPGKGGIRRSHYFTAADVLDSARVHGMMGFFFACYSAGMPSHDNFLMQRDKKPAQIAKEPFVSALPQRLLSHPEGGALAVIGHVERAWGCSFQPVKKGGGSQIQPFRTVIGRIIHGEPVGHALNEEFSERYTTLSSDLLSLIDTSGPKQNVSDKQLVNRWIERNDAQNYVVLGDPACRVRTELFE